MQVEPLDAEPLASVYRLARRRYQFLGTLVVLGRIQEGTQRFVVDQQGYLQGFLAVFLLDSFANYGMQSPTQPILTGPVIVDASNIDATLQGVEAGVR